MSKRRACAASVVLSLVVLAVAAAAFLGLRIPYSSQHGLRRLRELPPDPGDFAAIDLTRSDLRALNLRNEGALLRAEASFDSLTAWPIEPWKKPVGFHPRAILEEGKNPGLGVRELHKRGITGKGIAIGIIDQDLLLSHTEYNERLRLYEVVDGFGYPQMHGAVAMLWPLLRERRPALSALIGAVVCVTLIPFTPVGVPILCAALGILVGVPTPAGPAVRP